MRGKLVKSFTEITLGPDRNLYGDVSNIRAHEYRIGTRQGLFH